MSWFYEGFRSSMVLGSRRVGSLSMYSASSLGGATVQKSDPMCSVLVVRLVFSIMND